MSRLPTRPQYFTGYATSKPGKYKLPQQVGHISFRNVGPGTLWISWDGKEYFDIADGTSFEEDQEINCVYVKTLTGVAKFTCNVVPWI